MFKKELQQLVKRQVKLLRSIQEFKEDPRLSERQKRELEKLEKELIW